MVLGPTKSLLHLEERSVEMMKTYLKNEEEKPRIFYTEHTNEELGVNSGLLPAYTLPDNVPLYTAICCFDCEWTTKYINKASFRQKTLLIQIAFKTSVYLFHLGNTYQMPGQLKLLIEDTNVIKVGRCIKQDLQKLEADYHVDKT
ncbi:hypothetical protein BD408DRAFT_438708 [Parasitella parasitica]|nr:hypothetical protein BD408DRAFT_438708 [Parasitella parasitica]